MTIELKDWLNSINLNKNNIIKEAIGRPVAVVAIIFLAILFGYVALQNIPIQMSPDIEKPIYQVRVSWPGAAPADVDREIINRLEQELSSLNGSYLFFIKSLS